MWKPPGCVKGSARVPPAPCRRLRTPASRPAGGGTAAPCAARSAARAGLETGVPSRDRHSGRGNPPRTSAAAASPARGLRTIPPRCGVSSWWRRACCWRRRRMPRTRTTPRASWRSPSPISTRTLWTSSSAGSAGRGTSSSSPPRAPPGSRSRRSSQSRPASRRMADSAVGLSGRRSRGHCPGPLPPGARSAPGPRVPSVSLAPPAAPRPSADVPAHRGGCRHSDSARPGHRREPVAPGRRPGGEFPPWAAPHAAASGAVRAPAPRAGPDHGAHPGPETPAATGRIARSPQRAGHGDRNRFRS